MKYNDNGTIKDIYVKAFDTLPVGAIVEFDGSTIPDGWEEVEENFSLDGNLVQSQNNSKINNLVNLAFTSYNSSGFAGGSWQTIATLPVGYRPSSDVFLPAFGSAGGWSTPTAVPIQILASSGAIQVFLQTSSLVRIIVSGSFLTN